MEKFLHYMETKPIQKKQPPFFGEGQPTLTFGHVRLNVPRDESVDPDSEQAIFGG